MLQWVVAQARAAAAAIPDAAYMVATDDKRIEEHCVAIDAPVAMTDPAAKSGSDRALEAAKKTAPEAKYIINLQGDAPFTPVRYLTEIAAALHDGKGDVATPCIRLDWAALDALREAKRASPTSGTTCVTDRNNTAIWFSKSIIPTIRNEAALRTENDHSPVLRHVGLYGYSREALENFAATPPSQYESLEGLEQLRMVENGVRIYCVIVDAHEIAGTGVDTPEDLEKLNALIKQHGDPGVVA